MTTYHFCSIKTALLIQKYTKRGKNRPKRKKRWSRLSGKIQVDYGRTKLKYVA